MKKNAGILLLLFAAGFAFADWDKSVNFGMSFPVFNQKYELWDYEYVEDEESADEDDWKKKFKEVGASADFQGRFVNNSNNLAFMGGCSIGILNDIDAGEFLEIDEINVTLDSVTLNVISGAGYRFVNTERLQLTASALVGMTMVNLFNFSLNLDKLTDSSGKSIKYKVNFLAFDFELGADIFARFLFNEHWGISASCSALFTVFGMGKGELKAKNLKTKETAKVVGGYDVKPGSFIFVPRIMATYRF